LFEPGQFTSFVSDPHNRPQAKQIQKAIDAIAAGKTANEVMTLLADSPPPAS
jgi:hypothetical protein